MHQAKLYEQALTYMQGQENMYSGLRTRTAVLEHVLRSFARSGRVHWPTNPRVIVTLTLLKVVATCGAIESSY